MSELKTVRAVGDLRSQINEWRREGLSVTLVPTMGALHDGHLSLVKLGKEKADKVCVSLFVNPRQFGPTEDFDIYPRDEAADAACLSECGADLLYAPGVGEMYPEGHSTSVQVGPVGDLLEGKYRPGFFTGVATIVTKLLLQCLPDIAIFGEKDYQQLQVIQKAVTDLDIPVSVLGAPTVREEDGLAMSSRNAYLTVEQRAVAPILHQVLSEIAEAVNRGGDIAVAEVKGVGDLMTAGFRSVDYLTVRDAVTLGPLTDAARPKQVLVAAQLGDTRLIDNIRI